jgi:hypothetical protein
MTLLLYSRTFQQGDSIAALQTCTERIVRQKENTELKPKLGAKGRVE